MNYILFDDEVRQRLLPFTHTRPVADIRCGILTMRERWEHFFKQSSGSLTEDYMQEVFPVLSDSEALYINSALFATAALFEAAISLNTAEKLVSNGILIAFRSPEKVGSMSEVGNHTTGYAEIEYGAQITCLKNVWDIFSLNDQAIRADFDLLTEGKRTATIPEGVTVSGNEFFIEQGAKIYPGTVINTIAGPVYIGKDAEVLEGSLLRGPLAICEHSVVKMGAKIYGATTIGPGSKVGGEISNVVFFANSNKGHDGYLGNAVIGEWCNLGADTNCSNLKNNYDEVKIWDEQKKDLVKTGLTFCGLLMGDHSKCGINTMFNTGTVVGVSCNIYGGSFPDKFIPSFSWGGSDGMTTYKLDKALETANRMMARRNKQLSDSETKMYDHLFSATAGQRSLYSE